MKSKNVQDTMRSQFSEIEQLIESGGYEIDSNRSYGLGAYINGIKLEWNVQGKTIKLGFGNSTKDNDKIASWLKTSLNVKVERSKGNLSLIYPNPTVDQFKKVYDLVSSTKLELEQPQRIKKGKVDFNRDSVFLKAAKVIKLAVDEGLPQLLSRGCNIFDGVDNIVVIGESQERTEKDSYREHIVPCDFLVREAVEMYRNGRSLSEIAVMFQQNLYIVLITNEQANTLNSDLGLKVDMPEGWKLGDNVFARLNEANIKLK